MSSFQVTSLGVPRMDKQKKILGLLIGEKKVYFEKTKNQIKMIEISRELDRSYRI